MTARTMLGMLTPSSNTVLEPICAAMLRELPTVSAHFSRFRVTEISLTETALGQFAEEPMLESASLLADAHVQSICWNGTSASWLGFDRDRALCAMIANRLGIPMTSAVLTIENIFRLTGVRRYGLVTPYLADVQERIISTFRNEGFECAAERNLGLRDNFSFSEVTDDTLQTMVREVAQSGPDAIIILCTNLAGAPLVEKLEQETGIPIYDSTAAALWGALRLAHAPAIIQGWGQLFRNEPRPLAEMLHTGSPS